MIYKRLKELIIMLIIVMLIFPLVSLATEEVDNSNMTVLERIRAKENPNVFTIYSESACLLEEETGNVLYDKNMHDRKYPASTTKILTAIIIIENCEYDEMCYVSENAINSLKSGYTKANLKVGESFTVEDMLKVLMLQSANEAAVVLAEHQSGSVEEFSKLMNEKAREIGCTDSNFVNPNGMHDENHYSSAYDMALIGRYAMQNEKFRKLVREEVVELPDTEIWTEEDEENMGKRIFYNTTQLFKKDSVYYYPYAVGIKAGFTTPAKNCFVGAANKDGKGLISSIMHAEQTEDHLGARYVDTINLFEYGFRNCSVVDVDYTNDGTEESFVEEISKNVDKVKKIIVTGVDNNAIAMIVGGSAILLIAIFMILLSRDSGKRYYSKKDNKVYLIDSKKDDENKEKSEN